MALLQEIQEQVNLAQEEIRKHNNDRVRKVIWPDIKDALNERNDLKRLVRYNLGIIIHKDLDEQDLQGGAFTPIIVEQLVEQAEKVQELEPKKVVRWLPF